MKALYRISLISIVWMLAGIVQANALKGHHSPYLAMHGDDPVQWMEWGEAALDKAKQENKPLFISSGYFSCHWCHVMHKESFKNAEIAALINAHFVPVKIDRELNPVLDQRLIAFVQATNHSAGWPLNVFMSPDGNPMAGAVYIPPEAFTIALERLQARWKADHKALTAEAVTLNQVLAKHQQGSQQKGLLPDLKSNRAKLINASMGQANDLQGGFGQRMQFPRVPALLALFRLNQSQATAEIDDFLQLTLDQIQSQGLNDLVAGGFYRYTIDPAWEVPHFEKMLYTNAMLPVLFLEAAKHYQRPDYALTAQRTLDFLQAEMLDTSGGYYASLSAVDDKDIEGGFYLWQQEELQKILSADEITLANQVWGLDKSSELAAGQLPRLQQNLDEYAKQQKQTPAAIEQQLHTIANKLKQWRDQHRVIPKDNKLLAAWNGLTLGAYASYIKNNPDAKAYQQQGEALASFLASLWDGKQLKRSQRSDQTGTLSDFAYVAWGLMQWGKVTEQEKWQQQGTAIAKQAWSYFRQDKGWQQTQASLLPNPVYRRHLADNALPSPETLLLEASLLSNDDQLIKQAKAVLKESSSDVESDPFSYGSLLELANR